MLLQWEFESNLLYSLQNMDMDLQDLDTEDRYKLWLPQARMIAEKARSGDEIARFLRSKGIPQDFAGEKAAELWQESCLKRVPWKQPKNWIGGYLLIFGLSILALSIGFGGGLLGAIGGAGLSASGAAVLWGGFLERT